MERITPLIAAILTVAFFSSQADAVEYVQAPPLSQVVTVSVGEVSASDPVQVPLITWGGDIATIYANGSNKRTQKSSVFNSKGLDLSLVRQDDFKKQVEDFVSGKSPYLRGTLGMVNQALEVLEQTKARGLMIGRGAIRNPWLFAQIRQRLRGVKRSPLVRSLRPTLTRPP